jgi:type VI protein secretion system component VasA
LRIRIACDGPQNLGHLDFDRLEFFLSGPDIEALKLLELVMEHHAGIVCQTVSPQPQRQLLASDSLRQEGFEPDQALLPDDLRNFDGYRLLQEYFAFPARFRFISLSGLGTLIQRCEGEKAFDIFILLDKSDEQLERVVDASHLALHCTPVINLFPKVAARQKLNEGQHEYHLVVDNIRPLDYEIYAVKKSMAARTASATTRRFVRSGAPGAAMRATTGPIFPCAANSACCPSMPCDTARAPAISVRKFLSRWWMNSTRRGRTTCATFPPRCCVPAATCR